MDDFNYTLCFLVPIEDMAIKTLETNALLYNSTYNIIRTNTKVNIEFQSEPIIYHLKFHSSRYQLNISYVKEENIVTIQLANGLLATIHDVRIEKEEKIDPKTNIKYDKFTINFKCNENLGKLFIL